jgi:hypothetical protein
MTPPRDAHRTPGGRSSRRDGIVVPEIPAPGRAYRVASLALALVAGLWALLRALPTEWIEAHWLPAWLPPASRATATAIEAVPVSLTALSAVALVVVLGVWAWRSRRRGQRHRLVWMAAAVLMLGPAFEWAWGMGYRRLPLEARLGLPAEAPDAAAAWAALDRLAAVAAATAPGDLTRLAGDAPWWDEALAHGSACVAAADAYVSDRSEPLRLPQTVRRLPAGTLLRGGFSGVQAPWWREPHVDGGLPPAAALTTGLHEVAHAAGWAGEAETDTVAILAGLACADPDVRFASAVHGLPLVRAELLRLHHADPGWRQELDARWARLPPAVRSAWSATSAAVARHRSVPLQRVATATYGVYLRAHGVAGGMADYGRAGVLVVAALERCEVDTAAPWCAP